MSKADRAKKRAKRFQALADQHALPKSEPTREKARGRARMAEIEIETANVALMARAHMLGKAPTDDVLRTMKGPHMGSPIGVVLHLTCEAEECTRLWGVYADWCRAEASYRRAKGFPAEAAKGVSLLIKSGPEAEPPPKDTRTDDEKLDAAVNAWMRWQGWLGHLAGDDAQFLHQIRRDELTLHRDGEVTPNGIRGKAALVALAKAARPK